MLMINIEHLMAGSQFRNERDLKIKRVKGIPFYQYIYIYIYNLNKNRLGITIDSIKVN